MRAESFVFFVVLFVTVVLFNTMVNLCSRKIAYLASALMSCIYIMLPIPELPWGQSCVQVHRILCCRCIVGRNERECNKEGVRSRNSSDRFACIELFLVHLQSNYRSYVVYDRLYWHCWHDSNFSAH